MPCGKTNAMIVIDVFLLTLFQSGLYANQKRSYLTIFTKTGKKKQ